MSDMKELKSQDNEGKEVKMMVKRPESVEYNIAQETYLHQFKESLDQGAMLRNKLEDYLKEQKIWTEAKETQLKKMTQDLTALELKLKAGNIKLSEGKELYFEITKARAAITKLNSERNAMDINTAEGQADNARFNSLVSQCVYKEDGKTRMFESLDDYLSKSITPYGVEAAGKLANMMYGLEDDYDAKLPENKFMVEYNFMDKDLNFLNKDGHMVDSEDRKINDKGHFLNDDGERVDLFGNLLDADGEYIVDVKPFLDDDGVPIIKTKQSPTKEDVIDEIVKDTPLDTKKLKVRKLPA